MKTQTFNNRTKNVVKNSKGYEYAKALLTNGFKVYTCHTSGRGRFTSNLDYTQDTIHILELVGLKNGIDFVVENDSPRGGKTGNFIQLTSKGKSKMIK